MAAYLTGILGIGAIMAIWYAVQALARRQSRCALDHDMLEGHSCGACDHSGRCARKGQQHGTV